MLLCGYRNPVHKHNEASYQKAWCKEHNGIEEYQNKDFTRVDCLTDKHAVEFDYLSEVIKDPQGNIHHDYKMMKDIKRGDKP